MGFFDRFEKAVDHGINGVFSKTSKGEVQPVELTSAIERELDEKAAILTRGRAVVPNEFVLELSTHDFDKIIEWGAPALGTELQENAVRHAADQKYAFVGPVSVTFEENVELQPGVFTIRSETVRNVEPAPISSAQPSASHPIIDVNGQRYFLTSPCTVIGRGSEADIIVEDTGVSRRHVEISITPDGPIATDLGSTNGTFVEGHRITAATLVDGNTITLGRTRVMFWTGEPHNPGQA